MSFEFFGSVKELDRMKTIISILIRHGLNDIVQKLEVYEFINKAENLITKTEPNNIQLLSTPERLRHAFEEMGTTFIKLGQILSTRIDWFPPEWIVEFEKLQNHAKEVPHQDIIKQLEEDYGTGLLQIFLSFEEKPMASASIAQVHSAILFSGEQVVVKVRRPGIKEVIETDLRIMERLATIIDKNFEDLRRFSPKEIVRQFAITIKDELDLSVESRHTDIIAENFKDDPNIVIPKIYWPYTTERINVQEIIVGIPAKNIEAVDQMGLDRKLLAQIGMNTILKMILEDGVYHADPHPGNLFFLPGSRVALIDFGMIGYLTGQRRQQIIELLYGLITQDAEQVCDVLLDWSPGVDIQVESLQMDVEIFIRKYHGVPLKRIQLSEMLGSLISVVRKHRLILPPDLPMLVKTLVPLEGIARRLTADFDMVGTAKPYLEKAITQSYSPNAIALKSLKLFGTGLNLLGDLPKDIKRIARVARSGGIRVHVEVDSLMKFGKRIDSAASRIAVASIIAALIIGSAIVMTVGKGPTIYGLPFLGFLGFVSSIIGGTWMLYSIRKGGKDS